MPMSAKQRQWDPQYPEGTWKYVADLASFLWWLNTMVSGKNDVLGQTPQRDLVLFESGQIAKPSAGEAFAAGIGVAPSMKEAATYSFPDSGGPFETYRSYWFQVPGMQRGGVVQLQQPFDGQNLRPGVSWDAVDPEQPTPHDKTLVAKRLFGEKEFKDIQSVLITLLADRPENPDLAYKMAWCTVASWCCNMAWCMLNVYPDWIDDVMRLYLAGGPIIDWDIRVPSTFVGNPKDPNDRLRYLLGTPWPKNTRGPFYGFTRDAIPNPNTTKNPSWASRARRWPTFSEKNPKTGEYISVSFDSLFNFLNSAHDIPYPNNSTSWRLPFHIPHPLGSYSHRYQWMRKLSFFMPSSAWMGTVFRTSKYAADIQEARRIMPARAPNPYSDFETVIRMWSLFSTGDTAGDGREVGYFEALNWYAVNPAAQGVYSKRDNSFGLDFYYKYHLRLWVQFFSNAYFPDLVKCNHAVWDFAMTNAGPGRYVGGHNVKSETSSSRPGLTCAGLPGDPGIAPANDYEACALTETYPELLKMEYKRDRQRRLGWRAAVIDFYVQFAKLIYAAYSGNIVGFATGAYKILQTQKRVPPNETAHYLDNFRAVPPPFLRMLPKYLNGIADPKSKEHQVHPSLRFNVTPYLDLSMDPFCEWTWSDVKVGGGKQTEQISFALKYSGGSESDLDKLPQSTLYAMKVSTALKSIGDAVGLTLQYEPPVLKVTAADIVKVEQSAPVSMLAPAGGGLLDTPKSKLPAVVAAVTAVAASLLLMGRRKGRR